MRWVAADVLVLLALASGTTGLQVDEGSLGLQMTRLALRGHSEGVESWTAGEVQPFTPDGPTRRDPSRGAAAAPPGTDDADHYPFGPSAPAQRDPPRGAAAGPPGTNGTDRSVTIPRWYGRLGNNAIQIVNAILYCQLRGFSRLLLPPKGGQPDVIDLPEEIAIQPPPAEVRLDCNWGAPDMRFFFGRCLDMRKSVFRETLKRYVEPFLTEAMTITCQDERSRPFDGLTIHLRSGDTRHINTKQSMYAPCSFFEKVVDDHKFHSVRIVTEPDFDHPCLGILMERIPNVRVQSRSLEEDACAIMNSRHLAVGSWSTFSGILELFNADLESLFWPVPPPDTLKRMDNTCRPVTSGTSIKTYVYQIQGMQNGHHNMNERESQDYFARLPTENVTMIAICDEQRESPFAGAIG